MNSVNMKASFQLPFLRSTLGIVFYKLNRYFVVLNVIAMKLPDI
jgi:hypothetical protein